MSQRDENKTAQFAAFDIIEKLNISKLLANYQIDKKMQKTVTLLQSREGAKISRLPAPWRAKFNSFSTDERDLLYMDERLVFPPQM